jgi:hypothetical protein
MSRGFAGGLSRLRKLEQSRRRFAHVERLSDDDLIAVIFGRDTPEFRAAQALWRAGDDAGFDRMIEENEETHARAI